MDTPRAGVFVLFVLVVPVSCEGFFTGPVVCYFLDAFLMLYCIVATALFFREKFSVRFTIDQPDDIGGIYQELERPGDDDAYQVLETSRGRKKGGKKKRSRSNQAQGREMDTYESVTPSTSAATAFPPPPLSPR
ncbi:T-cell surface glycoprotein CD3 zeta chain-like isoform X2 [Mugil cephalus]|uniref:T-cell surface glycoprotein CD3 zeta chain-like isoform X2 n=1 Tax=Mugil cephalus TaxID=48193 RepID=UPI001FB6FC71|nr:T-cell surface glycoprotein CD3 zeta chain-like isoform X2 [Mugil cephalus]